MDSNFSVNSLDVYYDTKGSCYESDTTNTKYLLYIIFFSLSFIMICGNLLVITSIIYFKQLHTPTNFLILSLAVADLIVGIFILPYRVIPVNRIVCLIILAFDFYLTSSSILTLCFISVDRYFAVCQPLRYRTKINVRVTGIMILVSWTLPAIGYNISTILQDILCFFLPVIIMCALYLKILTVAQRQARSIQKTTCQSTTSESKMQRKATKTLFIVMGVFLITWSPYFIYMAQCKWMHLSVTHTVFTLRLLGWANSLLNPFIYGFFYSWFRSAFIMIISGKIFQGDFTHSKLS